MGNGQQQYAQQKTPVAFLGFKGKIYCHASKVWMMS